MVLLATLALVVVSKGPGVELTFIISGSSVVVVVVVVGFVVVNVVVLRDTEVVGRIVVVFLTPPFLV